MEKLHIFCIKLSSLLSLPDQGELAANMLDISYKHAIVGDYPDHNDFPRDEGVAVDFEKVFPIIHEIISRIRG
jgi:hypothetical protein